MMNAIIIKIGAKTILRLENISGLNSVPLLPPPDIRRNPSINITKAIKRTIYFFLLNKNLDC